MSRPSSRVYDDSVLASGANATSTTDRKRVLNDAVNRRWAAADISMIRRVEKPGKRWHYAMWRYPSEVDTG